MAQTSTAHRGLALTGGAVVVGLGLVGLVWHLANADVPHGAGVSDWWGMGVVAAASFGPTGAWLAAARPRLPLGWIFLAIGFLGGASLVATEYGLWALEHDRAGAAGALWLGNWVWVVGLVPIASVVPLLLPDGRLPSVRWRPALGLGVAAAVAAGISFAFTPYSSTTPGLTRAGVKNPVAVGVLAEPAVSAVLTLVVVAGAVCGVAGLVVRWRRSSGLERLRLKWVLLGVAAAVLLFALGFVAGPTVTALAMVPLPLGVVVAVLRYGLADVDVVISRSLVYVGLSGLVVLLYLALVWVLTDVLGQVADDHALVPVLATTAVALGILPLRDLVQRRVNQLVHGAEDEPYAVLSRLGERLGAATTPDDLIQHVLPSVAEQVARSLHAETATLALREGPTVTFGHPGVPAVDAVTADLVYAGERLGTLTVTRTGGFDTTAQSAVTGLASQAAVAAHTVLLARDTQRSRELAVLAREEERRRLRRDLHDGVGPSLAALALQVETARALTADDPSAAVQILDRLSSRLNEAVAEVRAMVNELRPPMLDELGLAAAVRHLGDRFTTATTRVTADAGPLPDLPAAVEVAAYQIAGEATTNAARHAGASRVDVTLAAVDGMIRVEVCDNGSGIAPDARRGVGLASMETRATELGGHLDIRSGATGTVVTALLPREVV